MTLRPAFTLLELLVSIAIIGVLVGLTAGGIQKVRAAAARASCANNLRQLALAAEQYHHARSHYPTGFASAARPKNLPYLGWPGRLLPYLEQDALWRRIEAAFGSDPSPLVFYGHAPHAELLKTPVRAFACPADGRAATSQVANGVPVAFTSYLGNSGRNHIQKDGVLFADSVTRQAEITDGLSNTLLIGERPPAHDFRIGWWYRGWGLYDDGTAETVLGVRERNFTNDYRDCPPGPYKFAEDKASNPCAIFHFYSPHPGGAHWALCDGSVRFVRYSAADALTALSTRARGDTAAGLD